MQAIKHMKRINTDALMISYLHISNLYKFDKKFCAYKKLGVNLIDVRLMIYNSYHRVNAQPAFGMPIVNLWQNKSYISYAELSEFHFTLITLSCLIEQIRELCILLMPKTAK